MASSSRKRSLSPSSSLNADQRRRLFDADEVNLQNEKLTDDNRTLTEELNRNKEKAARQLGTYLYTSSISPISPHGNIAALIYLRQICCACVCVCMRMREIPGSVFPLPPAVLTRNRFLPRPLPTHDLLCVINTTTTTASPRSLHGRRE